MNHTVDRPLALDKSKGTLLLHIDASKVDLSHLSPLTVTNSLEPKPEFHITLIGFVMGKKLVECIGMKPVSEQDITWKKIEELIAITEWNYSFRGQYFHISKDYDGHNGSDQNSAMEKEKKEKRESYIEIVDMPCVESFFNQLSSIISFDLEIPLLHVTLFTKSSKKENMHMGIGISSIKEFQNSNPVPLLPEGKINSQTYSKIILPTRIQPDTIAAIFLLQKYGEVLFPGVKDAKVEVIPLLRDGQNSDSYKKQGTILLDIGGGAFDHHNKKVETTLSDIIATTVGVKDDASLQKLLEYARRDDMLGKGTISSDPLDRAFGLSGLLTALNKTYAKQPSRVVEIVIPLIAAHVHEEERRTKEMPLEFESKLKEGKAEVFAVKQRDKKLKVVIVDSENPSLPGFLRSQMGGRFDVVAQWLPSGHVNILTRPTKHVDLRALVALIRAEDMVLSESNNSIDPYYLARSGRVDEVPHWYYDTATNSILNGGIDPKDIAPTQIPRFSFKKILELGLSEALWSPIRRT